MPLVDFLQGTATLSSASWGRIRLFCEKITTDGSRTQVVHDLSSGDVHPVQDRGRRARRVRCKLQFDDFPGAPSPREAADAMEAAVSSGATAMFQHPTLGRFLASIGEFMSSIDEHSVISADAEFIQEDADQAVSPTGAASSGTSGESSVAAASTSLDTELSNVGKLKMSGATLSSLLPLAGSTNLSFGLNVDVSIAITASVDVSVDASASITAAVSASVAASASATATATASATASATVSATASATAFASVSASADASAALSAAATADASAGLFCAVSIDARVSVSTWASGDVSTRQILIDASRISDNIATMIDLGGFESDLQLWPAFRTAIMLGDAVRNAAIAATSESPSTFTMRVLAPVALLPLAARVYGGADAIDRMRQIQTLNDIATPGWLVPGDYLMPTRTSAQRAF